MIITTTVDYNHDSEFRDFLAQNNIKILNYVEHGPSGGNPAFTIEFSSKKSFDAFGKFYFKKE